MTPKRERGKARQIRVAVRMAKIPPIASKKERQVEMLLMALGFGRLFLCCCRGEEDREDEDGEKADNCHVTFSFSTSSS